MRKILLGIRESNIFVVIGFSQFLIKINFFQYYAQFDLQGSENHKDLYDSLKKWREERKMKPDVSLTISVGDPLGGPDDTQNFLADPFRVSLVPRPRYFVFISA